VTATVKELLKLVYLCQVIWKIKAARFMAHGVYRL